VLALAPIKGRIEPSAPRPNSATGRGRWSQPVVAFRQTRITLRLVFLLLRAITVATYIERLGTTASKPTVKQHLAAIRRLFDYLTTGGILEVNPAASVREPKYVIKRGKTPMLSSEDSSEEARKLLDSIESNTLIAARPRISRNSHRL
jgi:site-specific recombinase XerC